MGLLLILSQSNSGSTWLSSCLKDQYKLFPKEYFNSILNYEIQQYADTILGNEQEYFNLAVKASKNSFEYMMRYTWLAQNTYNATKENYLAFNIQNIKPYFKEVVMLFRSVKYCFPPQRSRVKVWYNQWYQSLLAHSKICPEITKFNNCIILTHQKKALLAWQVVRWQLELEADRLYIPTIDYDRLMNYSKEEIDFNYGKWLDADKIVETRKPCTVPTPEQLKFTDEWSEALIYFKEIQQFQIVQKQWMY